MKSFSLNMFYDFLKKVVYFLSITELKFTKNYCLFFLKILKSFSYLNLFLDY